MKHSLQLVFANNSENICCAKIYCLPRTNCRFSSAFSAHRHRHTHTHTYFYVCISTIILSNLFLLSLLWAFALGFPCTLRFTTVVRIKRTTLYVCVWPFACFCVCVLPQSASLSLAFGCAVSSSPGTSWFQFTLAAPTAQNMLLIRARCRVCV